MAIQAQQSPTQVFDGNNVALVACAEDMLAAGLPVSEELLTEQFVHIGKAVALEATRERHAQEEARLQRILLAQQVASTTADQRGVNLADALPDTAPLLHSMPAFTDILEDIVAGWNDSAEAKEAADIIKKLDTVVDNAFRQPAQQKAMPVLQRAAQHRGDESLKHFAVHLTALMAIQRPAMAYVYARTAKLEGEGQQMMANTAAFRIMRNLSPTLLQRELEVLSELALPTTAETVQAESRGGAAEAANALLIAEQIVASAEFGPAAPGVEMKPGTSSRRDDDEEHTLGGRAAG